LVWIADKTTRKMAPKKKKPTKKEPRRPPKEKKVSKTQRFNNKKQEEAATILEFHKKNAMRKDQLAKRRLYTTKTRAAGGEVEGPRM
jgi:ribosomal protein L22